MERAEGTRREPVIGPVASRLRLAAGVFILAAMVAVAVMMLPPYIDNFRLQRSMAEFVSRPEAKTMTEDVIRTEVANRAARMGLPLRASQVRVDKNSGGLHVEILYVVRVDLPLYSVDLHFRPAAGSR